MWLFLKVPYVGLQCVIVVFLDHFSSVFLLSLSVLIIILIDLLQECSYCPLLAIGVRLIHAVPWNDLLRIKNNSIWGSIENVLILSALYFSRDLTDPFRERSGSVVECLPQDRRATGSSIASVTALCP